MSSLATVLSTSNPPTPLHVRKLCSTLLTQHLMRPDGVRAFCAAVFGELDADEEPELEKLEQVARVLGTVPRGMQHKVRLIFRCFTQISLRCHLHAFPTLGLFPNNNTPHSCSHIPAFPLLFSPDVKNSLDIQTRSCVFPRSNAGLSYCTPCTRGEHSISNITRPSL